MTGFRNRRARTAPAAVAQVAVVPRHGRDGIQLSSSEPTPLGDMGRDTSPSVRPPAFAAAPVGRCGRGFDCRQRAPALIEAPRSCREQSEMRLAAARRLTVCEKLRAGFILKRLPVDLPAGEGMHAFHRPAPPGGSHGFERDLTSGSQECIFSSRTLFM